MLHSLIVGIDRHADPQIAPLRAACADAAAIADVVRDEIADERAVTVLLDEDATKQRLERFLTEELPARVAPDDTLLLYFAGYGAPDIDPVTGDPSVHLVLHDTRFRDLFATALNIVSELSAWLRRLPVSMVTTVLDASFTGAPGGRTFEGPGLWSGPRIRRLERTSCARLAFGMQCAVLAACTDKELAREENGHGVFTHQLLQVLRRPDSRGAVRLDALHANVSTAVRGVSGGAQTPALHGTASTRVLFRLTGRALDQASA